MRPETLLPLTLDEHRELGRELRRTSTRLRELCKMTVGAYGPNSHAAFSFAKAVESLERLSKDMQAQAAHDCPGLPTDHLYV
ncbi:conserved hypothetical protein [Candidatus Sulfopaludibacter sp. SbA4]|nr:conserved hypothetical protein [Candidatus Sulfopaludibacter sp. SbA4]